MFVEYSSLYYFPSGTASFTQPSHLQPGDIGGPRGDQRTGPCDARFWRGQTFTCLPAAHAGRACHQPHLLSSGCQQVSSIFYDTGRNLRFYFCGWEPKFDPVWLRTLNFTDLLKNFEFCFLGSDFTTSYSCVRTWNFTCFIENLRFYLFINFFLPDYMKYFPHCSYSVMVSCLRLAIGAIDNTIRLIKFGSPTPLQCLTISQNIKGKILSVNQSLSSLSENKSHLFLYALDTS